MGFICYRKREKKAQSISAQNTNPHILSRGGYRKLEEKIMTEKKKSRPPPSEGEDTEPPSPGLEIWLILTPRYRLLNPQIYYIFKFTCLLYSNLNYIPF